MTWRIKVFFLRLIYYLIHIPDRFWRVLCWLFFITPLHGHHRFPRRIIGFLLLTIDLTPFGLVYESIMDWIKWKTRPLDESEKEMASYIFGNKFPYHLIGMDPVSIPAKRKKTVAYVSFHTINFDGTIPDPTFIHELVHVWQYQRIGAAYISEAIWAQRWGGGYDYGGLDALKKYADGPGLEAFNVEQQADIIEDYYRYEKELPLLWSYAIPEAREFLLRYVHKINKDQLKS